MVKINFTNKELKHLSSIMNFTKTFTQPVIQKNQSEEVKEIEELADRIIEIKEENIVNNENQMSLFEEGD